MVCNNIHITPSIQQHSHLSIYPRTYISIIYPSIHPSIYLSIHLSIHPSIYLFIHLSMHPSITTPSHTQVFIQFPYLYEVIYVIHDSILNREDRQSLYLKTPHGSMHDESLVEGVYIAEMMLQICSLGVEMIDG